MYRKLDIYPKTILLCSMTPKPTFLLFSNCKYANFWPSFVRSKLVLFTIRILD